MLSRREPAARIAFKVAGDEIPWKGLGEYYDYLRELPIWPDGHLIVHANLRSTWMAWTQPLGPPQPMHMNPRVRNNRDEAMSGAISGYRLTAPLASLVSGEPFVGILGSLSTRPAREDLPSPGPCVRQRDRRSTSHAPNSR